MRFCCFKCHSAACTSEVSQLKMSFFSWWCTYGIAMYFVNPHACSKLYLLLYSFSKDTQCRNKVFLWQRMSRPHRLPRDNQRDWQKQTQLKSTGGNRVWILVWEQLATVASCSQTGIYSLWLLIDSSSMCCSLSRWLSLGNRCEDCFIVVSPFWSETLPLPPSSFFPVAQ